jgi:pimeloyl-ACP methyl ester carboxylesterase
LRHVYVEAGDTVACGTLLAALTETPDEPFDAAEFAAAHRPPDSPAADEPASSVPASPSPAPPAREQTAGRRKPVAPAARALARTLGVELADVVGSGPNGRVTSDDVRAHASRGERLVEVEPGVALEVLREGAGDPLVLLPGFGSDLSSFALQTPKLAEQFALIGVNPRGVGASNAPATEVYTVERAADDVAVLLDEPTHVVGASLGAAAALELALRHPEKVRSLVLITPFVTASPRLLAFVAAWSRAAGEASADTLAAMLAPWLFGSALLGDDARLARILRGLAQSVPRVPAASLERSAAGMKAWSGTRAGDLGQITSPTLVIAAAEDLLTPDAERIADGVPGARCEVAPGCGHAVAIDAADSVTDWIIAHAKRS